MSTKPLPSLDELFDRFYVDSTSPTGLGYTRDLHSRARKDQPAGVQAERYCYVSFQGRKLLCHRIIAAMTTGVDRVDMTVDHIDRNRSNNHPFNLRWANRSLQERNKENKGAHARGVYKRKGRRSKPFAASVFAEGRKVHLGHYATEQEAHQAYLNFCNKEGLK